MKFNDDIHHDLAKRWDDAADDLETDPMRPVRYAKAFRYLTELSPEARLLEVGCGQGTGLMLAQTLGFRNLVGIEVSAERLSRAKAKLGPDVELRQVDAECRWDFRDGEFDACFSCAVIEHAIDPADFIAEIARVVRPGGYVVISSDCWQWRLLQMLGVYKSVQPIDVTPFPTFFLREFKRCGLELVHYEGFPLPGREYRFLKMMGGYLHGKLPGFISRVFRPASIDRGQDGRVQELPDTNVFFKTILEAPLPKHSNVSAFLQLITSDENIFLARKR